MVPAPLWSSMTCLWSVLSFVVNPLRDFDGPILASSKHVHAFGAGEGVVVAGG